MNPLTQRLLMSAAVKGVIPGAWNLGNIGVNENIRSAGVLTGKLSVGTSIGRVYSLNNNGSWELADVLAVNSSPITRIDSLSTADGNYRVCTARASVTTRTSDTPSGAGNGVQLRSFSDAAWGSGNSQVLALRIVRNGAWVIAGENGAYAQSLSYGDTGSWTTATIPGAAGLGSLGDVVEIIYKETAAYSGDTTGWWAFLRGGRYVHTSGASYNGITNSNPNLFSGSSASTDLSSLFQSGETILSVDFVLNQFVVLTSFGRIFLSYTGFNWELRKDIRTGVNNHSFQDAVFDGQNYLVLASLQPGNNQIQVFTNKLENDTDFYDYNRFTIESAQQQPLGNFIFYHNNRYYIGLPGGQYLYKDVSVTPLTKPILVPLEMATYTNFVSQPIFINYYNDVDQKYETQDVVIINNIGNTYRESINGITVQLNNDSLLFPGNAPRTTTENYRRLIPISGNNNKLLIFGRRYRFRLVQTLSSSPPTGFQEQGNINFVNQWGNANFLGFDGAFASNKLLISLPSTALTAANLQYCRYLNGMFMNCSALNAFPKFPDIVLSSIWGMAAMLRNCTNFNQPIVNVNNTRLNTTKLIDVANFLHNASSFNNKILINLHEFDFPLGRNVIIMNKMFAGCLALTGLIADSVAGLRFSNDSRLAYYTNNMFENCSNLTADLATSGNIWDVSRVWEMTAMFFNCANFNGNIDNWDTSSLRKTDSMFYGCTNFNRNIGSWKTNLVTHMHNMFQNASKFNQNLTTNGLSWNTEKVFYMYMMFSGASKFNNGQLTNLKTAPLNWNTSQVVSMSEMFRNAKEFNQDLNLFNTGNVTNMGGMFNGATIFNGNIATWNTKKVTYMGFMFANATKFNSSLPYNFSTGVWDTGNVTNMESMFSGATEFNQNIGNWDVSKVTDMRNMFNGATAFNNGGSNSIQNWKTGLVTDMSGMFSACSLFNQPLTYNSITGTWDTSRVTNMAYMFNRCTLFNQNISNWNVSSVIDMSYMFEVCFAFNSDISGWNVSNVTNMRNMFAACSVFNSDISGWNVSNVTDMRSMFDGAAVFNQPIGLWGQKTFKVTSIAAMFKNALKFNQDLNAWNTSNVTDMSSMFYCSFVSDPPLQLFNSPIGSWDTSKVIRMDYMFTRSNFNQPIGSWNTSSVTSMSNMFEGSKFNQAIGSWQTSNVTDMSSMFTDNTQFDQFISLWDTSKVTRMDFMFQGATAFNNGGVLFDRVYNPYLGRVIGWDTSRVTSMRNMFNGANFDSKTYDLTVDEIFNDQYLYTFPRPQKISSWCVSLIPSAPTNFGFTTNAPVWGTCPTPRSDALFVVNINSNSYQYDLRTRAIQQGWDQVASLSAYVQPDVYVWSDDRNVPAFKVPVGAYPNGVCINNEGYIIGRGGNGSSYFNGRNGLDYTNPADVNLHIGGDAISVEVDNVWIYNFGYGYIAGGGGGGKGGFSSGGGGAGGGYGGPWGVTTGAYGGAIGNVGGNGVNILSTSGTGGGGGRILPGVGGGSGKSTSDRAGKGGGAGGGGGSYFNSNPAVNAWDGGNGGSANNAGAHGGSAGGGGGGWGAQGGGASLTGLVLNWPGGLSINTNNKVINIGEQGILYGTVGYYP